MNDWGGLGCPFCDLNVAGTLPSFATRTDGPCSVAAPQSYSALEAACSRSPSTPSTSPSTTSPCSSASSSNWYCLYSSPHRFPRPMRGPATRHRLSSYPRPRRASSWTWSGCCASRWRRRGASSCPPARACRRPTPTTTGPTSPT